MEKQTVHVAVMMEPALYKRLKNAAVKDQSSVGRTVRVMLDKYLPKAK